MPKNKLALGKGLEALFEDNVSETNNIISLSINEIESNKNQPRKFFDEESLQNLAESIREHGILQPIVVRGKNDGIGYQIIAGERRWRASKMIGLSEIPVIIKDVGDLVCAQIALVENLQRENLNPIEEAVGYNDLMKAFDMKQEDIAQKVGKSRSAVANSLRLLNLTDKVTEMVELDKISAGHARTLLGLKEKSEMNALAEKIYNQKLSVRECEKLINRRNKAGFVKPSLNDTHKMGKDTFYTELETAMKEELGRKIKVEHTGNEKGKITIEFLNKEDATEIANKLTK